MKSAPDHKRRLPDRARTETRFSGPVTPPANFRATEPSDFERLKERLLDEQLAGETQPEMLAALERASNDAAGLAWTMPLPLLVLPELFREKVAAARSYARRQTALRRGERPVTKSSPVAA